MIDPMLGTAPSDPAVYTEFIASRKAKDLKLSPEGAAAMTASVAAEEVALLPVIPEELDSKGITVFRKNETGLLLLPYMVRGFLKEAALAVTKSYGVKSDIDTWVHVVEPHIQLMRNGNPIEKADGLLERPLRAMTMQGPRVALSCSERVDAPCDFTYHIYLLPMAEKKKSNPVTLDLINSWLEFGIFSGFGQWRSGGYGRFAGKAFESGSVDISINDDLTVEVKVV